MTSQVQAGWQCPECHGPWIRNYVFKHNPRNCSIRKHEDDTQAADHERLNIYVQFKRPATQTELVLLRVFAPERHQLAEAVTTVSRHTTGVHVRTIHGINPDQQLQEKTDA